MKKKYALFAALLLAAVQLVPQKANAQLAEGISYQAIVRDANNSLVSSSVVGMQISIVQDSVNGAAVYVERQTPSTNANGLISIEIGNGLVQSGSLSSIDWANGPYFIKTETDPNGGSNYSLFGSSQFLSAPYALFARTAESITGSAIDNDTLNEI